MTHLWKSSQTYTFDIPPNRTDDIYGKNTWHSLRAYIISNNPKVTDVRFDDRYPLVHIDVDQAKHCDHPYFTSDDIKHLLETYMTYANYSYKEIREWYTENSTPITKIL